MSFNLYFAGSQHSEVENYLLQLNCNRLFTFADGVKGVTKQIDFYTQDGNEQRNIFLDSGAFSVARIGKTINIDQYIEFINSKNRLSVIASLDVIPQSKDQLVVIECAKLSWDNYLYMMDKVNPELKDKVLPVYHYGEPYSCLDRILNTEINGELVQYMGLGGGNAGNFKANIDYYKNIFNMIKQSKNPNIKVHAFGMTMLKILEMFPFYSADSTSWLQQGINGSIILDNGSTINMSEKSTKKVNNFINLPEATKNLITKQVELKGYNVEDLRTNYKERLKYNILYFKTWADNYEYKGLKVSRRRMF